jgi:probable blue pigment (indigoidine) exporter
MSGGSSNRPGSFQLADGLLLAAVSVVWGAAYVFIREGIVLGASPIAFAAVRYLLSAGIFGALAAARKEKFPSASALVVSLWVGGVLMIGVYGGLLYWGEQYTTGGYAAVLTSTVPILTVTLGFSLLSSERLGVRGLVGMATGFVGTAVLVYPQLSGGSAIGSWEGPVFILGAMISTSFGTVLLRRLGRGPQGLWQIGSQFTVAGILLGAVAVLVPSQRSLPLTEGILGSLAFLVAFSSLVGYFAYFTLHHRVGPVRANIVAYLVPLIGVGIGTGLFGEATTWWEVAGVAVVLAGVSLVLWESAKARPASSPN